MIRMLLITLLFLIPIFADAQNVITLSEAISIALEKNHDILVAKNSAQQVENMVNPGMAGLLPNALASVSYNKAVNNTEIDFANPQQPPIVAEGAGSSVLNGGVGVQYQLADGFGNFYRFDILKMNSEQAKIQTQIAIENTVIQIADAFLAIVLAQKNVEISQLSVELSNQRLLQAKDRFEYGNGGKLELLSAQVDLNTDSVNFRNATANLENAHRSFAVVLGEDPTVIFTLNEEIVVDESLKTDEIAENALKSNANLVLSNVSQDLSARNLSLARSSYLPTLSVEGAYNYSEQNNDAGFILRQQNDGLNVGLSLQIGLFQGFRRKINVENAKVALESARLNQELALNRVQRDVLNTQNLYKNAIYTWKKDLMSVELAKENYERSMEAYSYGSINSTQLREAQLNFTRAEMRAATSKYSAKLFELQLRRLGGNLLVEFDS